LEGLFEGARDEFVGQLVLAPFPWIQFSVELDFRVCCLGFRRGPYLFV
jgi:hypothetical protein